MATGLFNLKQVNQAISQGAWSGYIAPKWVEYLVVAGGGAGGGATSGTSGMGGGGAGGLLTGIVTVAAGTSYTVTVGAGGTGGTSTGASGANSVFGAIAATGGGGGGQFSGNGVSGGSGGGGSGDGIRTPGQGIANQGNAGGTSTNNSAGGGGGAGTIGLNSVGISGPAGNGGAGIASAISGTVVTYAGGGGGAYYSGSSTTTGQGGVGGGGTAGYVGSTNGISGGGNTGGGGGGGCGNSATGTGGSGGSGIVVVRYPGSVQFFTGGTLSYANGYMIHTFYASGTLAPTTPTPYVTDYQISRSLRFNSADSAYLNRTPAGAGNQKTWTWSAWVKLGKISTTRVLFSCVSGSNETTIFVGGADSLIFQDYQSGAYTGRLITNQVFRDPSAWYHIVCVWDTSSATAGDRMRMYVNGVEVTSFLTDNPPTQNTTSVLNTTAEARIGGYSPAAVTFDGYQTEVNFIDGQALTPSSFGYTNPQTGVWSPLKFVGTYGTNGFYLNFSDNSNTTAATLGKDYSGNGNNWTPNNFSVTAGAGNDSLVDSPTSYGTDTGVGGEVRGNYATWNPLSTVNSTFANGNLDATVTTAASPQTENAASTFAVSSGKWYCEIVSTGGSGPFLGIADASLQAANRTFSSSSVWSYFCANGQKYNAGTGTAYGATWTTGDVIGIALDMDAGTVTFYKNGTSQGVAFSGLTGRSICIFLTTGSGSPGNVCTYTGNFGQRPFAYTAPSGFKALCTQNLPTPTIGATTATQAGKFFAPIAYSGTASPPLSVTVGFAPDFTWIKSRSNPVDHALYDKLRGALQWLGSSRNYAESTAANTLTSFDSNGFTVGDDGWTGYVGRTYASWNWKANGSGSTNTSGSVTSTVSANTTSGFSVVTWTGNGTNGATIGHGLGTAPVFTIVKSRSGVNAWYVWSQSLSGDTYGLSLNTTDSQGVFTYGNFGTKTSTTIQLVTGSNGADNVNLTGRTYVAYCFAEVAGYSKFGSYTGNGSSDGPFVYCGFRPAYVMVKLSSTGATADWIVEDSARDPYNVVGTKLSPNTNGADYVNSTAIGIDFLSNGFKIRGTDGSVNTANTYIFAAFAESPFKYSLAR